jgi:hypothetical protein
MDTFTLLPGIPFVGWLIAIVLSLLALAIHVLCALAVLSDASRSFESQHRSTVLMPGYVWAAAALLGGVTTTAIYWLLHHSTLRPAATPPPA